MTTRSVRFLLPTLVAIVACLMAAAGVAVAAPEGEGTGPALTAPGTDESLTCFGTLTDRTAGAPVLLVHGTGLTPEANYDWNYARAFAARGRPYCWVALPQHATGDLQVAAEHVVSAIRTLYDRSGGQISVVGYSQGGMLPRWALKYWPDTRRMVDDVIGIDPTNHGSVVSYPLCAPGCATAFQQQATGSRFLRALNEDAETWEGIDYTVVYTVTDELVAPNVPPVAVSELRTGRGAIANVAVQSICPTQLADHLSMGSTDPVGYAVVADALDHDGPADPSRIDRAVCLQGVMPAVDGATLPQDSARYLGTIGASLQAAELVTVEPPLRDYALAAG